MLGYRQNCINRKAWYMMFCLIELSDSPKIKWRLPSLSVFAWHISNHSITIRCLRESREMHMWYMYLANFLSQSLSPVMSLLVFPWSYWGGTDWAKFVITQKVMASKVAFGKKKSLTLAKARETLAIVQGFRRSDFFFFLTEIMAKFSSPLTLLKNSGCTDI